MAMPSALDGRLPAAGRRRRDAQQNSEPIKRKKIKGTPAAECVPVFAVIAGCAATWVNYSQLRCYAEFVLMSFYAASEVNPECFRLILFSALE